MRFYKIPFQASFVISDACRLNYDNEIFGGPMKIKMQQQKMDQTWILIFWLQKSKKVLENPTKQNFKNSRY